MDYVSDEAIGKVFGAVHDLLHRGDCLNRGMCDRFRNFCTDGGESLCMRRSAASVSVCLRASLLASQSEWFRARRLILPRFGFEGSQSFIHCPHCPGLPSAVRSSQKLRSCFHNPPPNGNVRSVGSHYPRYGIGSLKTLFS